MTGKKNQAGKRPETVKTNRNTENKAGKSNTAADTKKMGGREKGMMVLVIVLLIILVVKSTVLDEVKNLPPKEQQFKEFVDYSVARDHSRILKDTHLLVYRVFKIEMADEAQKAVLRYVDPETGKPVEAVQDGRYEAEVRGYFLGVLPVTQFAVTAEVQK